MKDPKVLIAVSASKGFIGWAIRKITGAKVNHSFLLYKSAQWGGWWSAQIDAKGVRLLPAHKATEHCDFIEVYQYSERSLEYHLASMRETVGEKYDYSGILGFLLRIIAWKVAHKKIRNALHSKGELFCSEFVAEFLRRAGTHMSNILKPSVTSPGDIRDYLRRDGTGFVKREWPLHVVGESER